MPELTSEPGSAADAGMERGLFANVRRVFGAASQAIGPQNVSLLAALVVLVALISTQTDKFFLPENLVNVAQSVVVVGIVAVVGTAVIVSGGLDLSVGSVAGLSGVVAALVANSVAPALGVAAGIAAGACAGLVNGLIVTQLRINPVITTIATLSAIRGLAFLVAPGGRPVGVRSAGFTHLGTGRVDLGFEPSIPYSVFLLLAVVLAMHLLLRYTGTGRAIYALGGNERAARLSGIRLTRMRLLVYTLSGAAAGLAGTLLAAQTFTGAPEPAPELLFDVITACFLGGCALEGGSGTPIGVLLAVILLGVLDNGMSLIGVETFYQLLAKGLLLIIAVGVQQWRARRSERIVSSG
jgi:ribose transport system permease protein/L-arabinose transport system permease protein